MKEEKSKHIVKTNTNPITFTVEYPISRIKEDINIDANKINNLGKKEIITKAFQAHSKGKIVEAKKYYEYFISRGFTDPQIFSNYGVILKKTGKVSEAIELYKKSINLYPESAESHYNLGNLYLDLGKLSKAEQYTKIAIELNNNFAEAHNNLGNILNEIGEVQEAEISLLTAIRIRPKYCIAYSNLGNVFRKANKLKEAESSYRKAIKINPSIAEYHSNLGAILKELNQQKEAELSLRKAICLKPNSAESNNNLGIILRDSGKLKEAEKYTRAALEINGSYIKALLFLGVILRDLGRIEELINLSESILRISSIDKGTQTEALLKVTIGNLIRGNFKEVIRNINKINKLMLQGSLEYIKDKEAQKNTKSFINYINALLLKINSEQSFSSHKKIPHVGESHCLTFSHQEINLDKSLKLIQPIFIEGAKAWHFANKDNNIWKTSFKQQIKQITYSKQIFISFGEIDCREQEGIIHYSEKYNKDIYTVCRETIKGYLNYMELNLSKTFPQRYYFGIPAPFKKETIHNTLHEKRRLLIKEYNSILKKEVIQRGSYFIDVYGLTSNKDGDNNNNFMCDKFHLSPKCLNHLVGNYIS